MAAGLAVTVALGVSATPAHAASPCDGATRPDQCAWLGAAELPPFALDAILAKQGIPGAGDVLVLTSGAPLDGDDEISTDMGQAGCGTNPDGWQTFDCVLLSSFVPSEDSVVLALSSEWFEWYQTIFTDWMTVSGAGVQTVDVSINSWIEQKVDILPYGPWETGVVILTSLSSQKMVDFRIADSGDHIYDTAILVVPAAWFSELDGSGSDPTLLCGNGILEPGEQCDDGNNEPDDGCSTLCLGEQPPPVDPPVVSTCGNLLYTWPNGFTAPYTCGADLCAGFRCVAGNTISPACYTAAQCAAACSGACVDVQTAQLDCSTMCTVQPPPNEPPPPPPAACDALVYAWDDGTTMPYDCDDPCAGVRCLAGTTISPECQTEDECAATCAGECLEVPVEDCEELCAKADLPATCEPGEVGMTRPAVVQSGPCKGNVEICKSSLLWRLSDASWVPEDEECNGIDDDCNGVVDDMFVTCGDKGLCQNTVNTCDPADPDVPVVCTPLPAPSPVEICNNGLDDDCDGDADDGCECGDDECMPGESYANCPGDCPPPASGTPCEDGNLCTEGESWQGGACGGGVPVVCDSGNACVIDGACDPDMGCTATKLDCADADPCTIDTCDAVSGCLHTPDPACGDDADEDGYAADVDCDDSDPSVHPGAVETCNEVDDDCDLAVDEGFDVGAACESGPNECGSTGSGALACAVDGLGVACDAVVPPNPVGYGEACQSAANACGETADGTVGCDGACDAVVPADPVGYGEACQSAANACGETASGTTECDGSCSAEPPAAVDSNDNGIADCLETGSADVGVTVEQLTAAPVAGKRLRYRVNLTNGGPDAVQTGVTVTIVVTGDVADLKVPHGCSGALPEMTCLTKKIRAGGHRGKRFRLVPAAGATVVVGATVSSPLPDPNLANQEATLTTLVP